MKLTFLLEVSTTTPRQYRVTVLEDTPQAIMNYKLHQDIVAINNWQHLGPGYYDTADAAADAIATYLAMEQ